MSAEVSLQEQFLRTKGRPVLVGDENVIQQDQVELPEMAIVEVHFLGNRPFDDNGVVLSIRSPGAIHLSDGTPASAVKIWDEQGLPRFARHVVDSKGQPLKIHNKYKIRHRTDEVTEDNFTGNAGMVVTQTAPNGRRYECSNGPGAFSKGDLVFEIAWKPFTN